MADLKILNTPAPEPREATLGFKVTPNVAKGAKKLFRERGAPESADLRVGVRGGGCSGLSYVLEVETEGPKEGDSVFDAGGVRVLVDKKSLAVLDGTTLDYKVGLMDAGFKFDNPRATKTCGCGESFSL